MVASATAALPAGEGDDLQASSQVEPELPPTSRRSFRPADLDAWLVFRTGIREGAAFRTVALILERGRWIQADVGYSDAGNAGEYRLFWAGAGGVAVDQPGARLELKAALAESFGTGTPGERYLLSNAYLAARPAPRWQLEVSHTEALPLNRVAARQSALDRARLEYEIGAFQLGVGYAGARSGNDPWQHRPFVSVSRPVKGIGEVELWLQRVERVDGATERLQLRFTRKLSS